MSECSKTVFQITADADSSVLVGVAGVLATFHLIPRNFRLERGNEPVLIRIVFELETTTRQADLMARQLGRLIAAHEVRTGQADPRRVRDAS